MMVVVFPLQAWATPILISDGSKPASSGDPQIQAWLISLINLYNKAKDPDLPQAVVGNSPDIKVNTGDEAPDGYPDFGNSTNKITLPVNLNDYLVIHWGGQGGGSYQAFYLPLNPLDSVKTYEFSTPQNGLSFYSFYGSHPSISIPEPMTLLLLGVGLVGLGGLARRIKKRGEV